MTRSHSSSPSVARRLPRNLNTSFGLLLFLLLAVTGFSIRTYIQLIEADHWNIHTYKVLLSIRGLNESLFTYDSSLRAYVTTRSDRFLEGLERGRENFESGLKETGELAADRPEQVDRIALLQQRFEAYLTRQAEPLIAYSRSSTSDAQAIAESIRRAPERRLALQGARTVIDEMEASEKRLLAARTQQQEALQRTTLWALWMGGFFSVVLVAALMAMTRASVMELAHANANLADANQLLEESNGDLGKANSQLAQVNSSLASINTELEREVMERKRAEGKLGEAVKDLERSNADLEQFAYIASHDLQEPLRAVSGCVQVLRRRYQGQLDEKAEQLIQHAVDGAQRMQDLINDLLTYSRLGTRGGTLEMVSMERVMDNVRRNLSVALEESEAVLTSDPLASVWGDSGQLTQALQNLVSNAIKFRGPGAPRIHVGCTVSDGMAHFSVADRGPGIEPQYFERIFVMFQRLHSRAEYPGTGIGLAVTKKIVERLGGSVGLESTVGEGTTFYFDLPVGAGAPRPMATSASRQSEASEL